MKVIIWVGTHSFAALVGYMAAVVLGLYATKNWSKIVGQSAPPSSTCHPACPCSVDLGA